MTGYQRIKYALGHKESDRVPIDLGGTTVTSMASCLLKDLLDYYKETTPFTSPDIIQGIGTPPSRLKDILGIDTIRIGPDRIPTMSIIPNMIEGEGPVDHKISPTESPESGLMVEDSWKINWEQGVGDLYFHQISWPLKNNTLEEGLQNYKFPNPDTAYITKKVESDLTLVDEYFPILDRDCAGMFEMSQRLRGLEDFFMDLYLDELSAEKLAEKLLAYKCAYWDIILPTISDDPDTSFVVTEADDFGTDASLLISPELIRKIYLPRLKRLITHIKTIRPQVKISFHSCGAVRQIIPDLIEAGVDILNPVQYTAAGMDIAGLKKDFGKDLVFWGGCIDTSKILPYGTPDEVSDEVKRVLDIMAPGGGFVASAIHNIQADVPVDNVIRLFETLLDYGKYN
jgi:uroporphyrinogen decarboxylase